MCQYGIDEKVLLLQGFRQRAARSRVLFLDGGVAYLFGNDIHAGNGQVFVGYGLENLATDVPYQDLSGGPGVAEVHPVYGRPLVIGSVFPVFLQEPPEVHPGAGVVGTGDNDVRQGGFFPVCGGFQRITLPLCLPREAEKTVDAGHKCRCLVQSEFRSVEQLASDVRFRDGIGVEDRHVQSRMSECL